MYKEIPFYKSDQHINKIKNWKNKIYDMDKLFAPSFGNYDKLITNIHINSKNIIIIEFDKNISQDIDIQKYVKYILRKIKLFSFFLLFKAVIDSEYKVFVYIKNKYIKYFKQDEYKEIKIDNLLKKFKKIMVKIFKNLI